MKETLIIVAAVLAGASLTFAAETPAGKTDQAFLKEAASGGKMEVDLGRIATQKAASERVKQFGQRMVDDHEKINQELKQLAARLNVTLPGRLGPDDQQMVDRLSKLHGAAFDRAYMHSMVTDHEKDVDKFRREAKSAESPDVREFAARTASTLEEHLQMAKDVSAPSSATSGAGGGEPGGGK